MKKTLAALAVLGAFAAGASAADVTLYGIVDLGLNYQYNKVEGEDATNTFTQKSGQNSGSRFGFKGTEDLGNGTKVGFILENGFTADDGKLAQGNRLFGREANLFVTGNYGTLSFGRVGALSAGVGSYNVVYGYTVFGTGWGDTAGAKSLFNLGDRDRFDNTVTYVTPNFAGFTGYAQYSFNTNGQEDAQETLNERYAAVGLKYTNGAFSSGLVVDTVKHADKSKGPNTEDALGVSFGASYDFQVAKVYGLFQYGKNENKFGYGISDFDGNYGDLTVKTGTNEGLKGYSIALGLTAPVGSGTAYVQANYLDAESDSDVDATFSVAQSSLDALASVEGKRYGIAAGYSYPFSKRTYVYTFAAYNEIKYDVTVKYADASASGDWKEKTGEFGLGLVHKF